jgi:hypothetical protein
LVYPRNPDMFWSFKNVLRLVSKRAAFPPLGSITIAAMLTSARRPTARANNTEAVLNFKPKLNREFLQSVIAS